MRGSPIDESLENEREEEFITNIVNTLSRS